MIKKKDMPKKIYIQIEDHLGEFDELGEATWCVDKINDSDIEYVLVKSPNGAARTPTSAD